MSPADALAMFTLPIDAVSPPCDDGKVRAPYGSFVVSALIRKVGERAALPSATVPLIAYAECMAVPGIGTESCSGTFVKGLLIVFGMI
jgi:hypothetical protein